MKAKGIKGFTQLKIFENSFKLFLPEGEFFKNNL